LLGQQKLKEAAQALRKANQLRPNHPVIRDNLLRVELFLTLDRKLTACLEGKARPASPREGFLLAQYCGYFLRRPRTALPFCLEAFKAEPKMANDLKAQYRYHAVRLAARAAAGEGKDAVSLSDEERARWRRQALTWLRADLALCRKQLQSWWPGDAASARRALTAWQRDPALAGLRDRAALARLPAEERAACASFWVDVAGLLEKTGKTR
jgi:hypothetical protein